MSRLGRGYPATPYIFIGVPASTAPASIALSTIKQARRPVTGKPRRGAFFSTPPTAVVAASTSIAQPLYEPARRPITSKTRRARWWGSTTQQVAPASPYEPARRPITSKTRRGYFFTPGQFTLGLTVDTSVAIQVLRQARRAVGKPRHATFFPVPQNTSTGAPPPPYEPARRPVTSKTRRGHFFTPGQFTLGLTVNTSLATPLHSRHPVVNKPPRRGQFFVAPVPPPSTNNPVAFPTMEPARRTITNKLRPRGRFWSAPLGGVTVTDTSVACPMMDPARRVVTGKPRRGQFFAIPQANFVVAPAPMYEPARRTIVSKPKRGQYFAVPLAQPIPNLPAPPFMMEPARRTIVGKPRKGRSWSAPNLIPTPPAAVVPARRKVTGKPAKTRRWGAPPTIPTVSIPNPPITIKPARRTIVNKTRRGRMWPFPLGGIVSNPGEASFASSDSSAFFGTVTDTSTMVMTVGDSASAANKSTDAGVIFLGGDTLI